MHNENRIWQSITEELDGEIQNESNLRSIIQIVVDGVLECGYKDFAESILSNSNTLTDESLFGHSIQLNVIPSQGKGACCSQVLCVAQRLSRNRNDLRTVLRHLRAHLINCAGITEQVVIITDVWDPKLLEESEQDLLSHRTNGLQILMLLVSGRSVTHVPFEPQVGRLA